ncbi:MAG TPA: FAD:protein FMN transferase [Casimicrobiaceae bacterium]|jgi:thiamine biosynthesis lipoprotein|nr:FAD:protein FMN transferase [Casimicrobiaceae bacterium]
MPLFHFSFDAMGSPNELQIWHDDERRARMLADTAIADVRRIEAKYSRYRGDSVTSRINGAAGGTAVAIDAETYALLGYADRCHRLSAGRFDITSGVLRHAWDFRCSPPRLPDETEVAAVTALIDWPSVEWSPRSVRLPRRGMEIDFGGIGKEYAADRMATICHDSGAPHALANLGGDVRAAGPQPDGSPWRVGISHPRQADAIMATVEIDGGAVATSGDYQRFFDLDGRRYCHIIDARSGRPVTHWQSISVLAPLCVLAGSCATIAMLLEEDGEAFLGREGVPYLAVDAAGVRHGPAAR